MASAIKTMVSKKKIRYKGDGFNLDLAYITDRLIAMGFPAEKFEGFLLRNSMEDVKRFLDEKHPDHYKIYNLCSERIYDPTKFHGRVAHYPFDDHHPPKFTQIRKFCEDVTEWLNEDQQNVAVVHCKAGKGRTGVMICCFLLHSKFCKTAKEVLDYYGKQRTQNEKGVTIPSQKRYINYYDVSLRNNLEYTSVKMYLKTVVVDYVPSLGSNDNYYLQFYVHSPSTRSTPYISEWHHVKSKGRLVKLEVNPPLLVSDDVKIEFSYRAYKIPMALPKKEFHICLNTFFFDKDFTDSNLAHEVVISQPSASASASAAVMAVGSAVSLSTKKPLQPPPPPTDDENTDQDNPRPRGKPLPLSEREQEPSIETVIEAEAEAELSSSDSKCSAPDLSGASCVERKCSNESDPGFYEASSIASASASASAQESLQSAPFIGGLPERHVSGGVTAPTVSTCTCPPTNNHTGVLDVDKCQGCASNDPSVLEALSNMVCLSKTSSISDDTLLKEQQQQRLNVTFAVGVRSGGEHENENENEFGACQVRELCTPPGGSSCASGDSSRLSSTATTQSSFITERMRHSSVPQAATSSWSSRLAAAGSAVTSTGSQAPMTAHLGHMSGDSVLQTWSGPINDTYSDQTSTAKQPEPISIDGTKISLKLEKALIDKACKNKNILPNFGVTLLLVKPDDQSDNLVDYAATAIQPKTPLSSQSSGESCGSAAGPWRASQSNHNHNHSHNHQPLSNSPSAACVMGNSAGPKFFGGSKSSGEQSSPESSSEEECVLDCDKGIRSNHATTTTTKREVIGQTSFLVHHDRRRHNTKGSQPAMSSPLANCNNSNKTDIKRTSIKPKNDQHSALLMPKRSNSNVEPSARMRSQDRTQNTNHQFNTINMMMANKAATAAVTNANWT